MGGDDRPEAVHATDTELAGTIDLEVAHADRCDPIAAEGCLLPFPNDHFTVADETTATGRRVPFDEASMPVNNEDIPVDPTHLNDLDGFSPAASLLVQLPDVDLEASGAAPVTDPAASLAPDSPVVLLDATTGDRLGSSRATSRTCPLGKGRTPMAIPVRSPPPSSRSLPSSMTGR
ncbi:hypothetical protein BH23ACT2_BH23ACT2_17600 [soil metagenome]